MNRPPDSETSSTGTVSVLSVSPSHADHATLSRILQESPANIGPKYRWIVYTASSVETTTRTLSAQEIALVISEDNLHPGTWQALLYPLSLLPDPPFLIVVSRLADERLWAEALNLGAWDVLAKPFDTQEVIRVVSSAWRHWQDRHIRTRQRSGTIGT